MLSNSPSDTQREREIEREIRYEGIYGYRNLRNEIIMWLAKKEIDKKVQTVRRRDGWLA